MSPDHGSHHPDADTTELVWFRRDLRLRDNPAWAGAALTSSPICALFVLDPTLLDVVGDLRTRQLLAHLEALDDELSRLGGRLRVERGDPRTVVPRVARDVGATTVRWNADTTPYATDRDETVAAALDAEVDVVTTWGTLVHPPGAVLTKAGTVSLVFTPFHHTWDATGWDPWPEIGARARPSVHDDPGRGLPTIDGDPAEPGGERAALDRLRRFDDHADDYFDERDLPAVDGTSALSVDLRFGTISPRRVISEIGTRTKGRAGFIRQLAWRDWYAHLLAERPGLRTSALKPEMDRVAWIDDADEFAAWCAGRTGYPIIDAGMRQLAETGRMHNRVRMLCASFLVKDLLIDWRRGEQWFRRQLLDGDVAQNVGNWQWAAGTGPDAAPYFRVFNPTTQSRKFDRDGTYIKRWVPELAGLDASMIHDPSSVGPIELAAAGVVLDDDYPAPIVDHAAARERALAAYGAARAGSDG